MSAMSAMTCDDGDSAPPPFSVVLLQTKRLSNFTQGRPLRDAWATLGPRLGHPRATQGPPNRQRVATHPPLPLCRPNLTQGHPRRPKVLGSFAKYHEPITKGLFCCSFFCQRPSTTLFLALERISDFTICSPYGQEKSIAGDATLPILSHSAKG